MRERMSLVELRRPSGWGRRAPAGAPKAGGWALSPARGAAQRRRLDIY